MRQANRRQFIEICGLGALSSLLTVGRVHAYSPPGPLGFMVHALRAQVLDNMPGTFATMAGLGYREVELISFKGFSGTGPREGFGPLASLSPSVLRDMIADAGLIARSMHVRYAELDDGRIDATLEWAHTLGLSYVTIADYGPAGPSQLTGDWRAHFDRLNRVGERVADSGLQLGIHTSNDMWHSLDDTTVIAALMQSVDARSCQIQLDLSTTQNNGVDAAAFLRSAAGRVFGVHLRDAKTPPEPVPYLEAAPLGQGDLDWMPILAAAEGAGVELFVVEMQTRGTTDPLEAYRISADFLRRL